jgi:hypothetical protein
MMRGSLFTKAKKIRHAITNFVRNFTAMGEISAKPTPPEPYIGYTPKRKGREDTMIIDREKAGKNVEGVKKTTPHEEKSDTAFNHILIHEGERPTAVVES